MQLTTRNHLTTYCFLARSRVKLSSTHIAIRITRFRFSWRSYLRSCSLLLISSEKKPHKPICGKLFQGNQLRRFFSNVLLANANHSLYAINLRKSTLKKYKLKIVNAFIEKKIQNLLTAELCDQKTYIYFRTTPTVEKLTGQSGLSAKNLKGRTMYQYRRTL